MNFAHNIRFPGSEDVSGFSDVQRHAPSEVRMTLYSLVEKIDKLEVLHIATARKSLVFDLTSRFVCEGNSEGENTTLCSLQTQDVRMDARFSPVDCPYRCANLLGVARFTCA